MCKVCAIINSVRDNVIHMIGARRFKALNLFPLDRPGIKVLCISSETFRPKKLTTFVLNLLIGFDYSRYTVSATHPWFTQDSTAKAMAQACGYVMLIKFKSNLIKSKHLLFARL